MQFSQVISLTLLILVIAAAGALAVDNPNIQARIYLDSKAQYIQFKDLHLDEVWYGEDYIEIATDQNELNYLNSLGFKTEVVIPDLKEFYTSRMEKTKGMGAYRTLSEINAYLDTLIAARPDLISAKVSVGQTIEGRDMWAVKISDNPNIDEDEIEVLYTAAIHAREVITPEVLFHFMNYLTANYGSNPTITDLVNNRELWFIPVVNPDGYYYNQVTNPSGGGMWRKNRRNNGDGNFGVDLNRNYDYMWAYDDEGSSPYTGDQTYRGTSAFSEPETQNMRDFITAHNFIITMYFHSYSNLVLYPWGYDRIYTPDNDIFEALADSCAAFNGYDPGPSWELYVVNGDSDDWGYGEQAAKNKNFAMTIEVGSYSDNFWPPSYRISTLVAENLQPCLFLARVADRVYQLRAPAKPVMVTADTVDKAGYDVVWSHFDTLNPAVRYELIEYQNKTRKTDSANNLAAWDYVGFTVSGARYISPTTSFYSGMINGQISYIQTKNKVRIVANDSLTFRAYYDIEEHYDYAYAEVSTDGVNYSTLQGNITTDENPYGNNRGNGITGYSDGWVMAKFDLSNYVGQDVFIRLSYWTDDYTVEEGIYFDDISPVEVFASEGVISSNITDTLYHFTDKAKGSYFYKVRAQDAQNQWGLYSELEEVYAAGAYLCGDANGNGAINALDITYLINYLYKGGAAPDPLERADVNSSGIVNALDITFMINFLYKGGAAPNCP
jgi:hypothetical protein